MRTAGRAVFEGKLVLTEPSSRGWPIRSWCSKAARACSKTTEHASTLSAIAKQRRGVLSRNEARGGSGMREMLGVYRD